ncbi:S8 family peptidase [Massilia sp. Dwa41.01b]|uniref:S8 family peptidase n=1 Tax=unclassified Massilia TaxID=2609279 RepID=UPI0015FFB096|nr:MULTISPECIES: S8 family peptidase [unclassified Massilia]QNA89285.1 S8 family peptidase [Massilia sp. Dwa41.01b]QNB00187.1 S8 family peptidase [Massilia sp. Se16.2.3]
MTKQVAKKLSMCVVAAAVTILCGSANSASAPADENVRVIVSFKAGAKTAMKSVAGSLNGTVKSEIFGTNAVSMEVPRSALKGLENNPNVEFIEEDFKRYPLALTTPSTGTPYYTGQQVPYGIKMVQADVLPDTNAANRKVCIIDSGLDRSHEDLSGNTMTGEYDSGTGWWYTDTNSHGTHVAGTIAAINNSGVGVVGVNANRRIKLHIVKVFSASGWAYSSDLATAANKCKAAGANVISMSLGGSGSSTTESNAFANIAAAGILSIAAAGNAGNSSQSYPAGYSSVVSVAAVDEYKQWASFSQYNSKVELAGPGVQVYSTLPVAKGRYGYMSGTSMATPHVAAVAALVWSYFPTCTASQIRTSLANSAQDLGTAGRDTRYGYGLVQAKTAYDRIRSLGCGR